MATNPPERRAACLLCGGRCDPDRWVCSNCHPRLLRLAVENTLEEARRDKKEDTQ